jgi:CRP/FNR family transcriptional regulator, dissimilatory nitrate respiration regulator
MLQMQFSIFQGIDEKEWQEMQSLSCTRRAAFEKNDIIFHVGSVVHEIGLVIHGSVHIESIDLWGNQTILSNVSAGEAFAESYALSQTPMMVDAVAASACEILFLNLKFLSDTRSQSLKDSWQNKLLQNLLLISVRKNLALSNRIFCTSPKSVRGRLLTYLSSESLKNNSTAFNLPFNRQQMADYLNLDRSALSKELCRMRDEGMLTFHKNHFELNNNK